MSLNVYPNSHTCDKTPNVLWVYFCHFHTFSRIPASQPETEIQVRLLKNVETTSFYFLLSGPSFGKCPQDISKTFDNYMIQISINMGTLREASASKPT